MTDESAFTGSIPVLYDRHLGPIIFADYAAEMARRVALHRPARVLETAAGTGIVTRALRDVLTPDADLTATDLQGSMLDVARTKIGPGEEVAFQAADATALPFADDSFDAVVCQFGVMFFPDKDKGYREMVRVLTPGGRMHVSVWDSHRHNPFGRIAHSIVGRFFPADRPQFQSVPFSYPFDSIKESLIAAGFADINCAVIRLDKILPDAAHFAYGVVYGSPLIDQIGARGGVEPSAIVAALTDAFHEEFGTDPGRMALQALFFEARKPE